MKKIISAIILAAFILVAFTVSKVQAPSAPSNKDDGEIVIDNVDNQLEEDGVVVQLENTGEDTWKYMVKTDLPNPCYSMNVDVLVAESFPEQVSFNVSIKDLSPSDTACIQVIQPVEESGILQVNENASFAINVER